VLLKDIAIVCKVIHLSAAVVSTTKANLYLHPKKKRNPKAQPGNPSGDEINSDAE
jgi:hypothetical protein